MKTKPKTETPRPVRVQRDGSAARPITGEQLWEIHDLAQRVIYSRQNVGTAMKEQARKVLEITTRIGCSAGLDRAQRRIVKAITDGGQYEAVMDVVEATIGHHVYEYVKVERLIDIIYAMAKRSNGRDQ